MTCSNCGTSNLDNATLCIQCGRPLTAAPAPPPPPVQATYMPPPPPGGSYAPPSGGYSGGPVQQQIPNYLVQSILVTLCCCIPLGVVAIIFAAQVNSKLAAGDVAGALDSSKKAKMFCLIGLGVGLVVIVLSMMFNGAMFMNAIREAQANR